MSEGGVRPGVWLTVLAAMAVLTVAVVVLERRRSDPQPAPATPASEEAAMPAPDPGKQDWGARERPNPEPEEVPYIEGLVWGEIDLREAQAVMPDNLYWQQGAPTKDPAVLEAREQEKKRRNEEYGRVLSGDANETEVDAYYDYRERLSADYLEFAEWMHNRYGDKISDEFRGMLELSIRLHKARLAQIPQDRDDARARSRERAKIREDWRREQEEFNQPAQ
jgi:hypothetical protein